MRQQDFFGEIELINNKSFEGKFTINESGEFKHIQSGCVFRVIYRLMNKKSLSIEHFF